MDLLRLLQPTRLFTGTFGRVVVLLVAANIGVAGYARNLAHERQANLLTAAGNGTGAPSDFQRESSVAGYDVSVGDHLVDALGAIPDARTQRLIVLSGMSQQYATNDPEPGDRITCQLLDDDFRRRGARVFGLAAPNLSNEELLLQVLALVLDKRTTPAVFVHGACFDKFRNVDLRPGYQELLRKRPDLAASWRKVFETHASTHPLAAAKMKASIAEIESSSCAGNDTFESRLRAWAGRAVPLIAHRSDLNAAAQMQLFLLRNRLLSIKPTTKRPLIPSRYAMNQQFLGLAVDALTEAGSQPVLYVVPLNPRAENPYVTAEYEAFKRWIEEFARRRGVAFANLEGIVTKDQWGEFMGGPDFKHFRGSGHRAVAHALAEHFGATFVPGTPTFAGAK